MRTEENYSRNQFDEFSKALEQLTTESLRHGFFNFTVEGKIESGKNKRREVIIRAGKEHKFNIPFEDLP